MTRDCEHGRQVGKCSDCDVAELEHENRLLRARNERLEKEVAELRARCSGMLSIDRLGEWLDASLKDRAAQQPRLLALKVRSEVT